MYGENRHLKLHKNLHGTHKLHKNPAPATTDNVEIASDAKNIINDRRLYFAWNKYYFSLFCGVYMNDETMSTKFEGNV